MTIRDISDDSLIFDRRGIAAAYVSNEAIIYRFDGTPVGYVHQETVWTFPGAPVGWFANGWLRTLPGYCVGFTRNAVRNLGPSMPNPKRAPLKLKKRNLRAVGARKKKPPLKPFFYSRWARAPLDLVLNWVELDAGG